VASGRLPRFANTHVVDSLCVATGRLCKYTGRDMVTAHTGLGITEEDWTISVQTLQAALNKFKVPAREPPGVLSPIDPPKARS
jgi:hemoglobin